MWPESELRSKPFSTMTPAVSFVLLLIEILARDSTVPDWKELALTQSAP